MKVSIIVPIYKTKDYLEKCLDSLVNQTYKDIQIILINDGSPYDEEKIVNKYKKKYKNIIYIKQENKGQGSARNEGIKKARGDYITFVDSDDYIDLNMIEELINNSNNEDIIISDILKEYGNKTEYFNNYWNVKKEANKNYMTSHMGPVARLYKTSLFKDNNLFFKESSMYEDLAIMPIIGMYAKSIKYINKAFYHYVIHSGSSMKQELYSKKLENIFDVMNHLSDNIDSSYVDEIEYLYTEHLLYSASLRFLKFKKKRIVDEIVKIMKEKYPKYNKNIYYKNKSVKFKLICFLIYHKVYFPLIMLGGK